MVMGLGAYSKVGTQEEEIQNDEVWRHEGWICCRGRSKSSSCSSSDSCVSGVGEEVGMKRWLNRNVTCAREGGKVGWRGRMEDGNEKGREKERDRQRQRQTETGIQRKEK